MLKIEGFESQII